MKCFNVICVHQGNLSAAGKWRMSVHGDKMHPGRCQRKLDNNAHDFSDIDNLCWHLEPVSKCLRIFG